MWQNNLKTATSLRCHDIQSATAQLEVHSRKGAMRGPKLFPVCNPRNVDGLSYTQFVNAMVMDDVAMVANKILRKSNRRLRPIQWALLIKDVAEITERGKVVKLARQAREVCSGVLSIVLAIESGEITLATHSWATGQ